MGIMDNEGHDPMGFGNVRSVLPMQADPDPYAALKDARAEIARLRHPFRGADAIDWQHLAMWIPDSGHGRFWKSVFAELKTALNNDQSGEGK